MQQKSTNTKDSKTRISVAQNHHHHASLTPSLITEDIGQTDPRYAAYYAAYYQQAIPAPSDITNSASAAAFYAYYGAAAAAASVAAAAAAATPQMTVIPDLSSVIVKTENKLSEKHLLKNNNLTNSGKNNLLMMESSNDLKNSNSNNNNNNLNSDMISIGSKRKSYNIDKLSDLSQNSKVDLDNLSSSTNKKNKRLIRCAAGKKWEDRSLDDWPENDYRLFVGDLGPELTDQMLESAFGKYPSFKKAHVVRDNKSGKSRGYGFVSFLNADDYTRAFRDYNNKYIGSRPVKLRKSTWSDRSVDSKNSSS